MKFIKKMFLAISFSSLGVLFMIISTFLFYSELKFDSSAMTFFQFLPYMSILIYVGIEFVSRWKGSRVFRFLLSPFKMGLIFVGFLFSLLVMSRFLDFTNDFIVYLLLVTAFTPVLYLYANLVEKWKLLRL